MTTNTPVEPEKGGQNADNYTDAEHEAMGNPPTTPDKTQVIEDYYHYQLVCQFCGETWWGLHCPHDGYQNPCPNCHKKPTPIKGNCTCELVAPIALISDTTTEARQSLITQIWADAGENLTNDVPNPYHAAIKSNADRIRELQNG